MKKSTKKFKRLFALLLIVLMSIENIGAVVSDNDGSAFITKAEFDSLKNNFQSQIDQYNTSIDSKIDGAIASYLAGINIQKSEVREVINKNLNLVTLTSYYPNNVYQFPNLSLYYSMMTQGDTYYFGRGNENGNWWKQTNWWWANILYNRSSGYAERLLCDAGDEVNSANESEKIVWLGRSKNLLESIVGSKIQNIPYVNDNGEDWHNTSKIRSVGLLNTLYSADKILQSSDTVTIVLDNSNIFTTPSDLNLRKH